MSKIHVKLIELVKIEYSKELREGKQLASLVPRIALNIDALLARHDMANDVNKVSIEKDDLEEEMESQNNTEIEDEFTKINRLKHKLFKIMIEDKKKQIQINKPPGDYEKLMELLIDDDDDTFQQRGFYEDEDNTSDSTMTDSSVNPTSTSCDCSDDVPTTPENTASGEDSEEKYSFPVNRRQLATALERTIEGLQNFNNTHPQPPRRTGRTNMYS